MRSRSLSLEHKLPLLMTAVLLAVLAASLALTYRTLSRSTDDAARHRLAQAITQVAGSAQDAMAQRARLLVATARDPVVAAALDARDTSRHAAAREVLARLASPADSGLPIEVWDARGAPVLSTRPESDSVRDQVPERIRTALLREPASRAMRDSARVSPLYATGNRAAFWVVAPIARGGTVRGYVAQFLRTGGARDASQALRELTGEQVTLYVRDQEGDVWMVAPGSPAVAPTDRDSTNGALSYLRDGKSMMATEAPVAGTPWIFVLEAPVESVEARPRETVTRLALLSIALVALGAALSWLISRGITRPLASLTVAAEAIAQGEYTRRVRETGRDEIGRLAESFNQMASQIDASRRELEEGVTDARRARAEAEAANRAKSDFLAVMSHELRTPLNAIGGYAQLLEMGIHGPVTEAQRDALTRINRSQAHLLSLINDVLNFAKIDAGQIEFHVTDVALDELRLELEAIIAPQVRAKNQRLEMHRCGDQLMVRADRDKVRQILLNLVSNAVKFTSEGGRITVDCSGADDMAEIRVRDTGIGIPEDRRRSIFEPFVQGGRALNRTHEGVGLGLPISRDLARAMGGDITVESEVGRGSVFTVRLPSAPVSSTAVSASPRMERRAAPG
jgi:signal transduction histidine kinase/type II secretory pathway pseudopilin PulG